MCFTVVFYLGHVIDKLPFHEPMGVVDVDRFALDIHARTPIHRRLQLVFDRQHLDKSRGEALPEGGFGLHGVANLLAVLFGDPDQIPVVIQ